MDLCWTLSGLQDPEFIIWDWTLVTLAPTLKYGRNDPLLKYHRHISIVFAFCSHIIKNVQGDLK